MLVPTRLSGHSVRVKGDDSSEDGVGSARRPSFEQRQALKGLLKQARKHTNEPLTPADWESYWRYSAQPSSRAFKRVLRTLPSTPRCGYCGAPFAGVGARLVGPFGYRPSRKNPNIFSMCVELARPGGMTLEIGIGLGFGEAFIGNIGGTAVHDFTAVGDVVNTASRLQGHAAAGRSCCPLGSLGSFRHRSACPSRSCSRASKSPATSAACSGMAIVHDIVRLGGTLWSSVSIFR